MVSSDELPKNYDFAVVEERWRENWCDEDHDFDRNSTKPAVCDRYAPALSHGQFPYRQCTELVLYRLFPRYKRMKGYNVMFPQGWDCTAFPPR